MRLCSDRFEKSGESRFSLPKDPKKVIIKILRRCYKFEKDFSQFDTCSVSDGSRHAGYGGRCFAGAFGFG